MLHVPQNDPIRVLEQFYSNTQNEYVLILERQNGSCTLFLYWKDIIVLVLERQNNSCTKALYNKKSFIP